MSYPPPPDVTGRERPLVRTGDRRAGTAIVAVVVTVAVLVVGLAVLGFVAWWTGGPDIGDAKAAAGRYLDRLEAGDDAGAYGLLCNDARGQVTPQQFGALITDAGRPVAYSVVDAGYLGEGGSDARVGTRVTDRAGITRALPLTVSQNADGKWQVCGDKLI